MFILCQIFQVLKYTEGKKYCGRTCVSFPSDFFFPPFLFFCPYMEEVKTLKLICILSTRDAGVAVKPDNIALRSGVLHIYSKVVNFQKDLDSKRWQMISHLKTQFGKKCM